MSEQKEMTAEEREILVSGIIKNKENPTFRLVIGIPFTGLIRVEWALARWGQIIPTNWSHVDIIQFYDQHSPLGYSVPDARNMIAHSAMARDFEWLLFIDHDTMPPADMLVKLNQYMMDKSYPIVCGVYFTKSVPAEPLVFRGRGTGNYLDWKFGDKVMVDGIPMGCTLIHVSILKALAEECEYYTLENVAVKRIFRNPRVVWFDPQFNAWQAEVGTEDIDFCQRVMTKRIFDKAGWPKFQEMEYPFLVDTSIFCPHIDNSGLKYPCMGEHERFMTDEQYKNYKKTGNLVVEYKDTLKDAK